MRVISAMLLVLGLFCLYASGMYVYMSIERYDGLLYYNVAIKAFCSGFLLIASAILLTISPRG
jgi:hypothetical protein